MKKIISTLISAIIISLTIFTVPPITAAAARNILTEEDVRYKIDRMLAGDYGEQYSRDYLFKGRYTGTFNVTNTDGSKFGRWKISAEACMGFGFMAFEKIFESVSTSAVRIVYPGKGDKISWMKRNLRAGDYVRYSEHSFIVYSTSEEKITIYDCNYERKLRVKFREADWENIAGDELYIVRSKAMDYEPLIDVTAQFSGKYFRLYSVESGTYIGGTDYLQAGRSREDAAVWRGELTADGWLGFSPENGKWLSAQDEYDHLTTITGTLQCWECLRVYRQGECYFLVSQKNNRLLQINMDDPRTPLAARVDFSEREVLADMRTWERFRLELI